jgi:hypothetical protein
VLCCSNEAHATPWSNRWLERPMAWREFNVESALPVAH